jgi:acetyl-CoA carboxylase biotin carboxylase subunit
MGNPEFRKGNYNTHFIENNIKSLLSEYECGNNCEDIVLIASFLEYMHNIEKLKKPISSQIFVSEWKKHGRRKNTERL